MSFGLAAIDRALAAHIQVPESWSPARDDGFAILIDAGVAMRLENRAASALMAQHSL